MITTVAPMMAGSPQQPLGPAPMSRSSLAQALMSAPADFGPQQGSGIGAAMPSAYSMMQLRDYLNKPADGAPPTDALNRPLMGANGMLAGGQMQSYNPGFTNGDALMSRAGGFFGLGGQ